jgi:hypothetical protein
MNRLRFEMRPVDWISGTTRRKQDRRAIARNGEWVVDDSSQGVPGVKVTALGVAAGRVGEAARRMALAEAPDERPSGRGGLRGATHTLVNLVIEPGKGLPEEFVYTSMVLTVQKGRIRVVANGGDARVSVGTGRPVREKARGPVRCEYGSCDIASGEAVELGPGNALSLTGGAVSVTALGTRPAHVQMSLVLLDSEIVMSACWICPVIKP